MYMAIKSKYDFIGCYEHDTEAGMLHVANHHISPGKKQWTWGHGDFGQAWDRNLTDTDGPYIELMTGRGVPYLNIRDGDEQQKHQSVV